MNRWTYSSADLKNILRWCDCMNEEYAWKQICRQIKRNTTLSVVIGIAFLTLVVGVITIIFAWKIGIVIIFAGGIIIVAGTRGFARPVADTDLLYERFFLTKWLGELFDTVKFSREYDFSMDELKEKEYFDGEPYKVCCARSFMADYKGVEIRASEVEVFDMPDAINRKKYYLENSEYIFCGRILEVDSPDFQCPMEGVKIIKRDNRTIILHNVYENTGTCDWWMPAPVKENLNQEILRKNTLSSVECYLPKK